MCEIVHFETTGCRLNQIESESAARFFSEKSFSVSMGGITAKSPVIENAVLCVVNTCAVTQKAEQKDRRIIRLLLEKCPFATVLVTGCYAELSAKKIEEIDSRISSLRGLLKSRVEKIADFLREYLSKRAGVFDAVEFSRLLRDGICAFPIKKEGISENPFSLNTESFLSHSRPSIKIQDGCNNSCSYCAIHLARGHSVSLDAKSVIERVQTFEKTGHTEVVITSVNIAQYRGAYNDEFVNITQLLKLLLLNTEKINIRLSSIYPEVVDADFCEVIKDKRIRPHFHISVQSGSDDVLFAMKRHYKAADVLSACKQLKKAKEHVFLACDIITGFNGETEEDFEKTLELCKNCGFSWVHVFPFSERQGTEAALMKGKIPQSVRDERALRLTKWATSRKIAYIQSCIGKEFDAILEKRKDGFHAVTENFLHCKISDGILNSIETERYVSSDFVRVRITECLEENAGKGGELDCIAEIL
ncbi:MAG: tRNA (N(6)-L-threonylcarbamoyladenosine(37)-C(2))-methylthiotransferase MtaB [Treponema sp.]|nr:tRNA (N(6)-L-threonylcarbamoyladenosine(37)-C(2))-methylthiotransferase MtaB [Treponema sp.]